MRLVRKIRTETHRAVQRVAAQRGYGIESVRSWVKQADIDGGVRLASMLGRFNEADRHLRVALATTEAFGWEYHRASTLVCLAETRLRRTDAPDEEATALLDEAQRICDELGIGWWADRITTLRHAVS